MEVVTSQPHCRVKSTYLKVVDGDTDSVPRPDGETDTRCEPDRPRLELLRGGGHCGGLEER